MKKTTDVYCVYIDFRNNTTEIFNYLSGEVTTITGVNILDYLHLSEHSVVFINSVRTIKNRYPGGKDRNAHDWFNFTKSDDIMEYTYDKISFRSMTALTAGIKITDLKEIFGDIPVSICMAKFLEGWNKDISKVRYSLAHNAVNRFYEDIKGILWNDIRKNNQYYFDVGIYKDCVAGNKAGWLCQDQNKRYSDVLMYDKRSAYGGVMCHDDIYPLTRTQKCSHTDDRRWVIRRYIKYRIENKLWFRIVLAGGSEQLAPWYDEDTNCTVFDFYDVVAVVELGLWKYFYAAVMTVEDIRVYVCRETGMLNETFRQSVNTAFKNKEALPDNSLEKFIEKTEIAMLTGKSMQRKQGIKTNEDVDAEYRGRGDKYLKPEMGYHNIARVRMEIIRANLHCGSVYWDTDGVKVPNTQDNIDYFNKQNDIIMKKNEAAGIDSNIGTWKFEGHADDLIVVRPKSYCYSENGKVTLKLGVVDFDTRKRMIKDIGEDKIMDFIWEHGVLPSQYKYTLDGDNIITKRNIAEPIGGRAEREGLNNGSNKKDTK